MSQVPPIADAAPVGDALTAYDIRHLVTYLRLLDADAEGADWQEVARIVLSLDPDADEILSRQIWASHLERAKWMAREGYRLLESADEELWSARRLH